jgi:hypothetical protein
MNMSVERWWKGTDRGDKYWENILSPCHSYTADPTWTGVASNPSLRGERTGTVFAMVQGQRTKINLKYSLKIELAQRSKHSLSLL